MNYSTIPNPMNPTPILQNSNTPTFTNPSTLKQIGQPMLSRFLGCFEDHLNEQGLSVPGNYEWIDGDYDALAKLFSSPELPTALARSVFAITQLAQPEKRGALENRVFHSPFCLGIDSDSLPLLQALQLWLSDPYQPTMLLPATTPNLVNTENPLIAEAPTDATQLQSSAVLSLSASTGDSVGVRSQFDSPRSPASSEQGQQQQQGPDSNETQPQPTAVTDTIGHYRTPNQTNSGPFGLLSSSTDDLSRLGTGERNLSAANTLDGPSERMPESHLVGVRSRFNRPCSSVSFKEGQGEEVPNSRDPQFQPALSDTIGHHRTPNQTKIAPPHPPVSSEQRQAEEAENQPDHPLSTPKTTHRRKGKVAHLPKAVRDQINQMLLDGLGYAKIIKSLGDQGKGLIEKNISNWKTGGFQDWLRDQEKIQASQRKMEFALDILSNIKPEDISKIHQTTLYVAALNLLDLIVDFDPTILRPMIEANSDKYCRLLAAITKLSDGAVRCERHRTDQAEREAKIAKTKALTERKKGVSDEAFRTAVKALNLL